MTTKYFYTSKKAGLQFIIAFDETEYFKNFELVDAQNWNFQALQYLGKVIVPNLWFFDAAFQKELEEHFVIRKLEDDLSFDRFWSDYKHKVGNKERCKKLWGLMDEHDKIKALAYIKKYTAQLHQTIGVEKVYPETYLHQKRWDNE